MGQACPSAKPLDDPSAHDKRNPVMSDPVFFDATLKPNRSLNRRGFAILIAVVVLFNAILAVRFFSIGAWPVLPFLGLDMAAVALAFGLNYRSGHEAEHIRLDASSLTITSVTPRGPARNWAFEPSWVRVAVDEQARTGGRVTITTHGKGVTVAEFLSPRERREMAAALKDALNRRNAAMAFAS
jgi:uncharacterized membrane protein